MTSQPASSASFAQSHRILIASLMGAPVMIGMVLAFVGSSDSGSGESWLSASPDPILAGIVVAAGAAMFSLIPMLGYRLAPLDRAEDQTARARTAQGRYQAAAMLRFALAETPVLLGVALAFVDGSYVLFLIGAVLGLGLMFLHVWPSLRVVERSAEKLEAAGVDSGLRREFGFA